MTKATLDKGFLNSYLGAFDSMEGMFSPDAALLFMAYNALNAEAGIEGDVLEIGVHHGLSAVAVASMRAPGRKLVAVDLFEELQDLNVSSSGSGNRERFVANMSRFFGKTDFIDIHAGLSSELRPEQLGHEFSFCHIDGGHSDEETYGDLELCSQMTMPGGLVALDDYFNLCFPGVCEGAVRFKLDHPGALIPVATGFNKVLFQKAGSRVDLNKKFAKSYPDVPHANCEFWGRPAFLFETGFRSLFDLSRSTPRHMVPTSSFTLSAEIEPLLENVASTPNATVHLPVMVRNQSSIALQGTSSRVGLSYHLLGTDGSLKAFDNARFYFDAPLAPQQEASIDLPILAPSAPGDYVMELDLVWEGITWFKQKGSKTAYVPLRVG